MASKLVFLALAFSTLVIAWSMGNPTRMTPERAVRKALPLLEHSGEYWFKQRMCVSCHHQALLQVTVALAKERGYPVSERLAISRNKQIDARGKTIRMDRLEGFGSINGSVTFPYFAWGTAASGSAPSDSTDATVVCLLQKQAEGGNWPSYSHRPPLEDSTFTATALAIKALANFAPSTSQNESKAAVRRAVTWLGKQDPISNEEAAMQIFGLIWGGAPRSVISARASALMARQRSDGGWAQHATRGSDAYATGQALVALHMSGISTESQAYRKGVEYLLGSQKQDGSWLVATRRKMPGLPYFESDFPHGKHQFISFAGTAWATMALMLASHPGTSKALLDSSWHGDNRKRAPLAKDQKTDRLLQAALWGTLSEMKRAVAAGAPIDGRSSSGASALSYAVRSPEKTAWLLSKGANVNAKSELGITPFLLACEYAASSEPLRLMLGARPDLSIAKPDFFGPIGMAATTGDMARIRTLVDMGARTTAFELVMAYTCQQFEILDFLCDHVKDFESALAEEGDTILFWAISDGSTRGVDILLRHGANPNTRLKAGLTPLMFAAMFDYGTPEITRSLLRAGAKPELQTREGKTALSLARKYGNLSAQSALQNVLASDAPILTKGISQGESRK